MLTSAFRLSRRTDSLCSGPACNARDIIIHKASEERSGAFKAHLEGTIAGQSHTNPGLHGQQVPKKPLVFLFTDKIAPPAMFKALSAEWQSSFSFYTIKDEEQFAELKQVFGIKKIPSLLLWKGEESVEVYAGTLKIGHINHWLKQAVKSGTAKSEL